MRLEILHVPDCPNVALLDRRLDEALAGNRSEVELTHRVVENPEVAAAVGMTGSPTLLVDGADPFAEPGLAPSVSCRLYLGEDGRVEGAPSVAELRRVLGVTTEADAQARTGVGSGPDECWGRPTDVPASAALSIRRGRATPTGPAERAVHQAILQAFAATGGPPTPAELDRVVASFEASAENLMGRLHAADVIRLGPDGQIRVAYPFSAVPTRHRVRLAGGAEVYAVCAIDALGMPAMLGVDAVIITADLTSGHPIAVTVEDGRSVWKPATAVVFVGTRPGGGPSVDSCCDYLNVFTESASPDSSRSGPLEEAGGAVVPGGCRGRFRRSSPLSCPVRVSPAVQCGQPALVLVVVDLPGRVPLPQCVVSTVTVRRNRGAADVLAQPADQPDAAEGGENQDGQQRGDQEKRPDPHGCHHPAAHHSAIHHRPTVPSLVMSSAPTLVTGTRWRATSKPTPPGVGCTGVRRYPSAVGDQPAEDGPGQINGARVDHRGRCLLP
ncbi:MAG: alkylmercury lyase family protein [Pseudonocardiales bacterium]